MKKTKLISTLRSFTPAEIKKFRDLVYSPFFNKNKNVQKLCDAVLKHYPEFNSDLLNEEDISREIFPGEKFDYFKIKNLSSDLYSLAFEFLKQIPSALTSFTPDYNLVIQLRERKLFNFHSKLVKSIEKSFSENKIKDNILLYNSYLISTESQFADLFEKPSSITGILNEFENYYEYQMNNLLFYYNLLIHIGKGNNVKINIKMLDDIVSFLEKGPVSTHPATLAYQYLILLKMKNNEEYFFILKDNYFKNFPVIDEAAAYRIHMYMFGYCADKFNFKGERSYIREGYELYKHSYLNKRVTSGELLYPDFINYVKVFTREGDTELASGFISDYEGMLPEDQKENSVNFANAYILHKKGMYNEALRLISKVNFPLAILKIQVRIMQVQLNYELNYYEETRGLIESFRKNLLKETMLSDDYKEPVRNFLNNTLQLLKLHLEPNIKTRKQEAKMLLDKISKGQQNHFGIKFWLEDMLEKLI